MDALVAAATDNLSAAKRAQSFDLETTVSETPNLQCLRADATQIYGYWNGGFNQ
jgi:hypothetical protein